MPEIMQQVKDIMRQPTTYKGSEETRSLVYDEIARRWGEDEAENYDPLYNCRTFAQWLAVNRRVKKGEKAIRSYTILEQRNEKGEVVKRYKRTVLLFYIKQTEAV